MFEVPAAKASKGQDRFEFSVPGKSGKFHVKKLKFLPIGAREDIADGGAPLVAFFCGETKGQTEAVKSLLEDQFQALVEAWQSDSGVTLGESEASDD